MRSKIKILDIVIIIFAAAVIIFSIYFVYAPPRGRTLVYIQGAKEQWYYPANAQETVTVNGVIGGTVIKIDGGRAWIDSSPCGNKTCAAAGFLTRQGQWAACLPNNVLLMLIGGKEDENIDSIAW